MLASFFNAHLHIELSRFTLDAKVACFSRVFIIVEMLY